MDDTCFHDIFSNNPNHQILCEKTTQIQQQSKLYRNTQKQILRKSMDAQRIKINSDTKTDARTCTTLLNLFPEEIWLMILKQLNSTDDIIHCMKTCALFDRLLYEEKPLLKFGQVLTHIEEFVTKRDLLALRLACKEFCKNVDTFLEALPIHRQLDDIDGNVSVEYLRFERFFLEFHFTIPLDTLDSEIITLRMEHSTNPFIGRCVRIIPENHQPELCEPLSIFLRKVGQCIQHLSIDFQAKASTNFVKSYYTTCVQVSKDCSNLKSLCLSDDIFEKDLHQAPTILEPNLPDQIVLNSLAISVNSEEILKLTDKLLEKYSNQLKYCSLSRWNTSLYQMLNWNSLQDLFLSSVPAKSDKLFQSLVELQAPNLANLRMQFYEEGQQKIINLLRVIQSFPKMKSLKLEFFCDTIDTFQNEEVPYIPEETGCCPNIQEITIYADQGTEIDFLIFFPLLTKLQICHKFGWIQQQDENYKNNFIDLFYWFTRIRVGSCTLMYNSRIWKLLPHLKSIQEKYNEMERTYTRQRFEAVQKLSE